MLEVESTKLFLPTYLRTLSGTSFFARGFTGRKRLDTVFGGLSVRWWSAALVIAADEQGTPVQNRAGPAAVTEHDSRRHSVRAIAGAPP